MMGKPLLFVGIDTPPHDHCHHIVDPTNKSGDSYYCRRNHFKGGWCWHHHPDNQTADGKSVLKKYAHLDKPKPTESQELRDSLNRAIVLLVEHGYQVTKPQSEVAEKILAIGSAK